MKARVKLENNFAYKFQNQPSGKSLLPCGALGWTYAEIKLHYLTGINSKKACWLKNASVAIQEDKSFLNEVL